MSIAQSGSLLVIATQEGLFKLALDNGDSGHVDAWPNLTGRYSNLEGTPSGEVYAAGFKRIDRIAGDQVRSFFTLQAEVLRLRQSPRNPKSFVLANEYDVVG